LVRRKIGLYAVIGNVVAVIIAYFLGGAYSLIASGLYGYNAVLTIIAVSAVFNNEKLLKEVPAF
jgi:urea transporter